MFKPYALIAAAAALLPAVAGAAAGIHLTDQGAVESRTADGYLRWRLEGVTDLHAATVQPIGTTGRVLVGNRYLVNDDGVLLARLSSGQRAELSAGRRDADVEFGWTEPVKLGQDGVDEVGDPPFVDSLGEAWVISGRFLQDRSGFIDFTRSSGRDLMWEPTQTAYEAPDGQDLFTPYSTIGPDDVITVVARVQVGSLNQVIAIRYEPGIGWGPAETIYQTAAFFNQLDVVADGNGDVAVTIELDASVLAVTRDAATGQWSDPIAISPPQFRDIRFPTLITNTARTDTYVVFWVNLPPRKGLYARRFISAAQGFGPLERIPGTRLADIPGGTGPLSYIPVTVDADGIVTVAYYIPIPTGPDSTLWVFRANRRQDGQWGLPRTAFIHPDREPDLATFGDAAVAANGDVFIVFPWDDGPTSYNQAVTYDAGADTWTPFALEAIGGLGNSESRMRVATRADGSAIAAYRDRTGQTESFLATKIYIDGAWQPEIYRLPGLRSSLNPEAASAGNDVVMAYEDTEGTGLFGTWFLREAP